MCNCKKGGCGMAKIAWVLVIIGGLNWGLVGLGMLMGADWNLVTLILGSGTSAAIVYLLVGICTVIKIFGCSCKKCKDNCKDCMVSAPMNGNAEAQGPKM